MSRHVFSAVSAAALSLALVGGAPVNAQGVTQLRDSVSSELAELGIDAAVVDQLTLEQLAQMENVFNGSDDAGIQRGRIEQIMMESSTMGSMDTTAGSASGGGMTNSMMSMDEAGGLEAIVRNDLASVGLESEVDVNALTVSQLAEIKNVLSGTDDRELQRNRIEKIVMGQ